MANKKNKKIIFNEEIDSAISGYTLAITFVGIGVFLLNNLDYFFYSYFINIFFYWYYWNFYRIGEKQGDKRI